MHKYNGSQYLLPHRALMLKSELGDCVATQSPIVCTQVTQIFSCCCLFIFFFFLPVHILASLQEWAFTLARYFK